MELPVVMAGIATKFDINNDKIAEPKRYLGGKVEKFQLPNGKYAWIITYTCYVQGSIDTVKGFFPRMTGHCCSRLELHHLIIRTWHTAWRPD